MSSSLDGTVGALQREPGSEQSFKRMAWRMLLAAMFCYLFFYTGRQAFGFAIPGIQKEFGWTKATVGTISGIALWSYAAGQMVNGNLVDKFGGRRLMALGAVLSTSFCIVASFQASVLGMAIALGANGFVQAMGWSAGGRVISNWWSHRERGKSFGFYTLAAGLASVLVFVTSTLTIGTFGLDWQWLFRVPVLLMLLGGVVFFLLARETPSSAGVVPPASFTADAENAEHDSATSAQVSSLTRYKAVLSIRKIWITGVAIGFQNAARYGLLVWVPVYFAGLDQLWVAVALPFGMAVGALTQGQVSDRLFGSRRVRPIMLFMVGGALAALLMYVIQPGIGLGIVLMFIAGFFVYGPQSSFWALCPDLAGKNMSGTATGVVNFFAYLFAGAAEPLIGRLMDTSGNTSLIFPIVAVSCGASAGVAGFIRR
jgi:OPA family glycerol-3-phosphate transporter-like MFS transporter